MSSENEHSVQDSIDHLFRQHAGQMVSVLCRIFGIEKIDRVEDAVQDSLIAAMKKWPFGGVPDNPSAWLIQTAKNKMVDELRRSKFAVDLDVLPNEPALDVAAEEAFLSGEVAEDQLRMMFACCDPLISPDSQVALTLKAVGGFNVSEIARAYLANDETIAKLLTRAKKKLRDGRIKLEIPHGDELAKRRDAVLRVLYLMFNEGYAATEGEDLIRTDLCYEAIRLARIVADHDLTSAPKANAVLALFLFQAARIKARTGHGGELMLMSEQDRLKWDGKLLAEGLVRFRRSATGDELSDYHIEAEIASHHAFANEDSTDWRRIIECYDILQSRRYSPVVELNRIVAIGKLNGSEAALADLSKLGSNYLMTSFNLFHLVKGHFLREIGENNEAAKAYSRALELTRNESIKRFICKTLNELVH